METIVHEIAKKISISFEKELLKLLEEEKDISEFILNTKKTLDEVGTMLVAEALETMNEIYRQSKDRKKHWSIKNKADIKTLSTTFGLVTYKRSYFINKETKECAYLSDQAVGIEVHDRLDMSLKSKLVENAIYQSYNKSASNTTENISLSPQTVMNSIRELGSVANNTVTIKEKNKEVKTLYIEADEDHVSLQTKGISEPKLIFVHEGKEKISKDRFKLKNVRYFSGDYPNSDDLWLEVADYIDQAYDQDKIENIHLSGDGAHWIKNGLNWIKDSKYTLDRFHLSKYITIATAHQAHTEPILWHYIKKQDNKNTKALLDEIINNTETDSKREAVQQAKHYILNNWEGIKNQYQDGYIGCSAEGHISHILSARLSSRPLGWCKIGVDQMARLRAFMANGGEIYPLFMQLKKERARSNREIQIDKEIIYKRKLVANQETLDNLPMLTIGKKTVASRFLNSIRGA